jgi:hypothetical protein
MTVLRCFMMACVGLLTVSCVPQPDPHNSLVRFFQHVTQETDLANPEQTLRYLQTPASGAPQIELFTLPGGRTITNYVIYLSVQPLPAVPGITIDRYDITYPGGPAAHGQTKPFGMLTLQASDHFYRSICVSEALMTWAFGKPILRSFGVDSFNPVITWRVPGPHKPAVTVAFSREGCGWLFSVGQAFR